MPKPKVISFFKTDKYECRFLNIPILGRPVDVFVECKSYDLEIPVNGKSKKELDIFEETILRMVELRTCSVDELADILCLKKDLVNFILIRLQESGLLEDRQTISDKGKELLNIQSTIREEIETVQGKLFIIKKTGLVLPYVHTGEFQSESIEDFDAKTITLGYGSVGNPYRVKGSCIRNSDFEKRMDRVLDARIVKKTIKTFNKIAKAKNMTPINLCEEYGITSSSSENIYFHLQAVVQEGNVDEIMFSDGFVSNIDGMMDYVKSENPGVINYIKSNAVDMVVSDAGGEEHIPFQSQRYREVCQLYENACRHLPAISYDEASVDARININEGKKQIIVDCYYMMEWAFYYYTLKNRVSEDMLNLIKQRSCVSNAKMFENFVKDLGLQYSNRYNNLFSHIDNRKIYSVYNYNSPKLYVCLPLAIAEAKENSGSDLHRLIQKNRGFLQLIHYLNENSGDLRHDSLADAIDMNADEILRETKRTISALLPDLILDASDQRSSGEISASRARLLSEVSLERKLGSIFFSALPAALKNEWIKISPDKKGLQLPDAREYVEILYRILQTELAEGNKEIRVKKKLSKSEALDILSNKSRCKLPKSFTKINEGYYESAVKGEKSTLGAEALVFFVNADMELADKLTEAKFVPALDRVMSLRGHAGMVALNEDEQSLNALRDDIVKISKLIGGYYD